MSTTWDIRVDRSLCIGSGMCAASSPAHFELGKDHKSRPRADVVDPDDEVLDAALNCPVEAITVSDHATGTVVAPE
jgi:ferredoxin